MLFSRLDLAFHDRLNCAKVVGRAVIQMDDLHIWTARPTDFKDEQWKNFVELLDATERLRISQFKAQADRRAYVLAHVLRRLALASVLAVDPSLIVFSRNESGKPLLSAPGEREIFFSHSHIRDAVVCAVTRSGPIGIDIESLQNGNADFDLLESFVVLPDAQRRAAELGSDPTAQFFFLLDCARSLLEGRRNRTVLCKSAHSLSEEPPGRV